MKGWRPRVREQSPCSALSTASPVPAPWSQTRAPCRDRDFSSVSHRGCPQPGSPAQPWGSCLPGPHPCSVGTGAVLPGRAGQGHAPCTLPAPHFLTKPLGWHGPASPVCPKPIPDVILAVLVNNSHLSAQLAMGRATAAGSQPGGTHLAAGTSSGVLICATLVLQD